MRLVTVEEQLYNLIERTADAVVVDDDAGIVCFANPAAKRQFERVYRAHVDGNASGMGLGLFITQHIVEAHGGHVTVEAPPDGGARFTVSLPLR